MKYTCIESTVDFDLQGLEIRIWINEERLPRDHSTGIRAANKLFKWANEQSYLSTNSMIDYIEKEVPNVNAIQVRQKGNPTFGTVVYTVPF